MDNKVKKTLPTPQFQKTEYVKRNPPSQSKVLSSSVTHPTTTMSSRKFSAKLFILENSDILQKIPSHLDPSMFSDDDDDDDVDDKLEEEDEELDDDVHDKLEEEDEEFDEEVKEENLGAAGFSTESNESHLKASSSTMPERSTTSREFHSSSSLRSAYPVSSTCATAMTSTERVKTHNENRLQHSADFRSHDIKHSVMPEATSSRVKTQNDSRFRHSADFKSHDVKHSVKSDVQPSREKVWTEKKPQDSVDHGSYDSKHVKYETGLARSLLKRQDNNTIEDFNWRKKVSKLTSHQAGFLIKSQQPVMEKIDELPNKRTDQKPAPNSSVGHVVSSHGTLERAKSHEDVCLQKENVPYISKKGLSHSVKSRSYTKPVDDDLAQKEKSTPCISREPLKGNENQGASQKSCSKSNSDPTGKSKVDLVVPKGINDAVGSLEMSSDQVINVNNKPYLILATLGSGGSCKVYSVYDRKTQSVYALKCVNLGPGDKHIMDGYKKEIQYLKKLQGSIRVIKMFDFEYLETEIRILLEKGDTDFAHYIANEMKIKPLSPIMIKFYWSQMLEAVAEIHKLGIVHSDLKPANFLLVAGQLKLIDFGIAASVPSDMTSAIRESQVGTLNFISPEALTTHYTSSDNQSYVIKVGVKSDVWSLGCILYNLVYGHTPFSSIRSMMPKMRAIIDPRHEISFPPIDDQLLLDVLKRCLKRDPKERASVEELLKHPYLASEAKKKDPSTPAKSRTKFQDMLTQLEALTPNRISQVLEKIQSVKKN